jgi:hypothetical protein
METAYAPWCTSNKIDTTVNQQVTQGVWERTPTIHDDLKSLRQLNTLIRLCEELQGTWNTVEDLKFVSPEDGHEIKLWKW